MIDPKYIKSMTKGLQEMQKSMNEMISQVPKGSKAYPYVQRAQDLMSKGDKTGLENLIKEIGDATDNPTS